MMKIALLNGSPRAKSVSGFVLNTLKTKLDGKADFIEFNLYKNPLNKTDAAEIAACDKIVIAAPLYVDALPSHVVQALVCIEENTVKRQHSPEVFAVSNGGFLESTNNRFSFSIISNWCAKCGFRWMYGLGIGSGERLLVEKNNSPNQKINLWSIVGLVAVKVFSYEPSAFEGLCKKSFGNAAETLARDILNSGNRENVYIRPFFPKTVFLNNLMTNASFFVKLKTNGNRLKDMTKKDL